MPVETQEFPRTYKGEEVIAGNDASQDATVPAGTTAVWVMAETAAVYVTVNGTGAAASSGFYCPDGQMRLIGPYSNISSLGVYAATGTNAHLVYEA